MQTTLLYRHFKFCSLNENKYVGLKFGFDIFIYNITLVQYILYQSQTEE